MNERPVIYLGRSKAETHIEIGGVLFKPRDISDVKIEIPENKLDPIGAKIWFADVEIRGIGELNVKKTDR